MTETPTFVKDLEEKSKPLWQKKRFFIPAIAITLFVGAGLSGSPEVAAPEPVVASEPVEEVSTEETTTTTEAPTTTTEAPKSEEERFVAWYFGGGEKHMTAIEESMTRVSTANTEQEMHDGCKDLQDAVNDFRDYEEFPLSDIKGDLYSALDEFAFAAAECRFAVATGDGDSFLKSADHMLAGVGHIESFTASMERYL